MQTELKSEKDVDLFSIGDKVVYPSHGVGEIIDIEIQTVANFQLKVYVISFAQDKMTLRVPVKKASSAGLRPLINKNEIDDIFNILESKPKIGNKMWSRRAQEYEAKINSGNIVSIAEVVRDLFKNSMNERSYSERVLYESALNRLASEIAMLKDANIDETSNEILEFLKSRTAA